MRIALVTPGITPYVMGGMQRHSFNLARHLARLGVEIDLYHTDFGEAKDIDGLEGMSDEEKRNITSIAVPWPQGDRLPGHYIRELKRFSGEVFRRFCENKPVDFIIAKSLTAWAFLDAKQRGAMLPPIGVNLHGFEMYQAPASFRSRLENSLMRPSFHRHITGVDYVFSYGGRITDLIRDKVGIPKTRILEIPGGIDEDWLVDEPSRSGLPRRFIFLGRYERRKGIEELHEAIMRNPLWAERAEFRFIGPIPEDKRLKLKHVTYAGSIRDAAGLRAELQKGDALLCPSHAEGMPNSILEGMASGLAVLATDVGAVKLLVSEANGVLLSEVDPSSIGGGIQELLGYSQNDFQTIKKRSLEVVKNFTWDAIASRTLEAVQGATIKS